MSANNIKVAIKVRPLLKKEILQQSWKITDCSIQLAESQSEPFYFDHIFDQNASNQKIFDTVVRPIVDTTIKGINGTIFAYGQTSSGKTYTMLGDEENPGVMVLAVKEIFKAIENTTDRKFLLRVGYIEIYNEKIYDLLNKNNKDLKIHETTNGEVTVNCSEFIVTSEEEIISHLQTGSKLRKCGETNMNERSSRSHAIFRLIVESTEIDKTNEDAVQISNLNLVDLAGSERADQTGATSSRLIEGSHINRSLLSLGCVIQSLSENESYKYINYRDSKLTRILQASLGGNALTVIICNIKPNANEETNSTLNFAMRAKTIKNKPHVNEILSDAAMMKKLEKTVSLLKNELEIEKTKNSKMKILQLEQQIKDEGLKIVYSHTTTKENTTRRRTWCPTSHENFLTENKKVIKQPQTLHQPFLTPLITLRTDHQSDEFDKLDDELFSPAFNESFSSASPIILNTPKIFEKSVSTIDTPSLEQKYLNLQIEFDELKAFTCLEKKLNVEHDVYQSLCQKLEECQANLKEKNPNIDMQLKLECMQNTIKQQDIQIKELQEKYEKNLKQLELEQSEKLSLDFEYNQYKQKCKNREEELLSVIKESASRIKEYENNILKNRKKSLPIKALSRDTSLDENDEIFSKECSLVKSMTDNNKNLEELNLNIITKYLKVEEQVKLLEEELEYRKIEVNGKANNLNETKKEYELIKFELDEKLKDLELCNSKLLTVSNENLSLKSSLKEKIDIINQTEEECKAVKEMLNIVSENILKYHEEPKIVINDLYMNKQKLANNLKEVELLKAENLSLQESIKNLESKTSDSNMLTNQFQNLLLELDGLQNKLKVMEQSYSSLQEQKNILNNNVNSYKNDLNVLSIRFENCNEVKLKELEHIKVSYIKDLEYHKNIIKELHNQIEDIKKKSILNESMTDNSLAMLKKEENEELSIQLKNLQILYQKDIDSYKDIIKQLNIKFEENFNKKQTDGNSGNLELELAKENHQYKQDIEKLLNELKESEKNIEIYKSTVNSLNIQVEHLQLNKVNENTTENEILTKEINHHKNENQKLLNNFIDLQKEIEVFKDSAHELKIQLEKVIQTSKINEDKVETLLKENNQFKNKNQKLSNDLLEFQEISQKDMETNKETIKQLNNKLEKAIESNKLYEDKVDILLKENKQIKNEISELHRLSQKEDVIHKDRINHLKEIIESNKDKTETYLIENIQLKNENQKFSIELLELKKLSQKVVDTNKDAINQLNNQLKEAIESSKINKDETETLLKENIQIKNENQKLSIKLLELQELFQKDVNTLEDTINQLNNQLKEAIESSKINQDETETLLKENIQIKNENQKLSIKLLELQELFQKDVNTPKDKINQLSNQLKQAIESSKVNKIKIEILTQEKNQYKEYNQKLSKDLNDIQNANKFDVAKLENIILEYKTKQSESNEKITKTFAKENERLTNKIKLLTNEIEELKIIRNENKIHSNGNVSETESSVTNLKQTIDKLSIENLNIKTDNEKLLQQINQITSLKQDNEKLNLKVKQILQLKDEQKKHIDSLVNENHKLKIKNQHLTDEIGESNKYTDNRRKLRRQSFQDETRSISFDSYNDVSTMTLPTSESCNCIQLDKKISELNKSVFIKDNQITALKLKVHSASNKDEVKDLRRSLIDMEGKMKKMKHELKEQNQQITIKYSEELKQMILKTEAEKKKLYQYVKELKEQHEKQTIICSNELKEALSENHSLKERLLKNTSNAKQELHQQTQTLSDQLRKVLIDNQEEKEKLNNEILHLKLQLKNNKKPQVLSTISENVVQEITKFNIKTEAENSKLFTISTQTDFSSDVNVEIARLNVVRKELIRVCDLRLAKIEKLQQENAVLKKQLKTS